MTNLVNIYFLLYISQVPLLILNEQTDQSLSVEIKSEFCVLCSCVYVPRVRERGLQTHSSLGLSVQIHYSETRPLFYNIGPEAASDFVSRAL
jgi:hypothetical protein